MSDPNDVVQRRDDNITDTTAASVVDVGQPRTPKQDLWDIDDDIFKPLLERVEEERRLEEKEEAAATPEAAEDREATTVVQRGLHGQAEERRQGALRLGASRCGQARSGAAHRCVAWFQAEELGGGARVGPALGR